MPSAHPEGDHVRKGCSIVTTLLLSAFGWWHALGVAPDKLNRAVLTALKMPDVQSRYAALGMDVSPMAPAEFDKFVDSEITRIARLARNAGIKAQ